MMIFFTVMVAVAIGAFWEIGEFTMDQMFSTTEQWGLDDTMLDLMMDTTGALIFALIASLSMKNGSFETAMHELDESALQSGRSGHDIYDDMEPVIS